MTIVVLPHAKKANVIPYITGMTDSKGRRRPVAPVIHGPCSPTLMDLGIALGAHQNLCQSFAYSWEEPLSSITTKKQLKVADGYRALLLGDLPRSGFLEIRVGHERVSGGCDLHDVWASTHLVTGTEFPFFSNVAIDWALLATYRKIVNFENGWSDPSDPWRAHLRNAPPRDYSPEMKAVHRVVDERYVGWIENGIVADREQAVTLMREEGLDIAALEDGIVLTYELQQYHFAGRKYRCGFDCTPFRRDRAANAIQKEQRRDQLKELRGRLGELSDRRREWVSGRFGGRFFDPLRRWGQASGRRILRNERRAEVALCAGEAHAESDIPTIDGAIRSWNRPRSVPSDGRCVGSDMGSVPGPRDVAADHGERATAATAGAGKDEQPSPVAGQVGHQPGRQDYCEDSIRLTPHDGASRKPAAGTMDLPRITLISNYDLITDSIDSAGLAFAVQGIGQAIHAIERSLRATLATTVAECATPAGTPSTIPSDGSPDRKIPKPATSGGAGALYSASWAEFAELAAVFAAGVDRLGAAVEALESPRIEPDWVGVSSRMPIPMANHDRAPEQAR